MQATRRTHRVFAVLDSRTSAETLACLRTALATGAVSGAAQKQALVLSDRIAGGPRIALLGPPGVGKSHLFNALMQCAPVQKGQARCFVTDACDTKPFASVAFPDQTDVTVERAHSLGHVQVLDLPEHVPNWRDLTGQILPHVDIVLWCTEDFSQDERDLWATVPDALKDHSFLVLTRADRLAAHGRLTDCIAQLQDIAADEFNGFFPTSTVQLTKAAKSGEAFCDTQFAASGVKALAEAVTSMAASGHRADVDSALVFVERHGLSSIGADVPVEQTGSVAPRLRDTALPKALEHARTHITKRALDLAELTFDADQSDLGDVLHMCGSISEELLDIVACDTPKEPGDQKWQNAFEEASDKVILMSMENDQRSAADAVSILLQLRRDLDFLSAQSA